MARNHVLSLDEGTSSCRSIVFDAGGSKCAVSQLEFTQHFPKPGWVEHDPEEIWQKQLATIRAAMSEARVGVDDIAGIGITNQRETIVVWDRSTGVPIHPAIVWQDRRTSDVTERLRAEGREEDVRGRVARRDCASCYPASTAELKHARARWKPIGHGVFVFEQQ